MKGRSRWFPRHVLPARHGVYECIVRVMGGAVVRWQLEWDGRGFIVPIPMTVRRWRGMTKKAHFAALKEVTP